jgi:hypothetical protein
VLHVVTHLALAQLTFPFVGAVHAMSQALQWLALVFKSTHCAPHNVEVGAVQPVTHE